MLNSEINAYVEMKQAMGFKYLTPNYLLQSYLRFAEQIGDTVVRSKTVIEWAGMAPSLLQKRNRLLTVRRFSIATQAENQGKDTIIGDEIGIRSLILDSFKKNTTYPMYVFVDANLPFGDQEVRNRWLAEINQTFSDIDKEGYLDSCPANIVIIHNDPAHFLLELELGKQGGSVWFYPVEMRNSKIEKTSIPMQEILTKANSHRLSPPPDFTEFN